MDILIVIIEGEIEILRYCVNLFEIKDSLMSIEINKNNDRL